MMDIKKLLEELTNLEDTVEILKEEKNEYGELEELVFHINQDGILYYVQCYAPNLDEEDNYHLIVYSDADMTDACEITDAWFDSTLGGYGGDELTIIKDDKAIFTDDARNFELEDAIMNVVAEHMVEVVSHDAE